MIYDAVRRLLFQAPPERIHTLVFGALRGATSTGVTRGGLRRALGPHDPILASTVFGVRFPGPMGLAAGFDKDGLGLDTWGALGFGYAEIGTVTARPQPGNPEPRLFRLAQDRGLLNRMGFNNVVNVSSPSTPGLRDLQAVDSLRPILTAVLAETSTPVLVKIAPDLSDEDVDAVADLAVELGLAGIVATNTTVSRSGLRTPHVDDLGPGGVSGPPVAQRALEVLRRLYSRVGDRLVLVGVGGIETADDAWERITAGASLLQGYTGFVYGGGMWAKHIHDGVAARLHAGGFSTLTAAVGSAHR